jgi:hypothetical protein
MESRLKVDELEHVHVAMNPPELALQRLVAVPSGSSVHQSYPLLEACQKSRVFVHL